MYIFEALKLNNLYIKSLLQHYGSILQLFLPYKGGLNTFFSALY